MPDPTATLLLVAIALLCLWAVSEVHRIKNIPPRNLHGWWHHAQPGMRWNPDTWKDASEQSLERSRRRRDLDD